VSNDLENIINRNIPIMFQKIQNYEVEDTRFTKVKIWLMHIGKNLNNSYFEKSVVEEAIPSLSNTPILGYIEDNSEGEIDFSDHRNILVKDNGKYTLKYIGNVYGVIPETNNAKFELRLCDDGIEREYLTVEGLIWEKQDEPIEILNRDKILKESMEIHDNYEGFIDETDNCYYFTKFTFFGACILGKDYQPAMINATVETEFTIKDVIKETQMRMEQFKQFQKSSNDVSDQEGGKEVKEKLELIAKYQFTVDMLAEKNISSEQLEQFTVEDLETKLKEFSNTEEPEVPSQEFTLNSQLKQEIQAELSAFKVKDDWGWEYSRYWFVDYDESTVYVEDKQDKWRLYGMSYSMSGDKPVIDFESAKRKKFQIVDFVDGNAENDVVLIPQTFAELQLQNQKSTIESAFTQEKEDLLKDYQAKVNDVNEKFSVLEKDTLELKEFKLSTLAQKRQKSEEALFTQFTTQLTEDEIKVFKEKASEFTIEDLENQLFIAVGKKATSFSLSNNDAKQGMLKVPLVHNDEKIDDGYGGLISRVIK